MWRLEIAGKNVSATSHSPRNSLALGKQVMPISKEYLWEASNTLWYPNTDSEEYLWPLPISFYTLTDHKRFSVVENTWQQWRGVWAGQSGNEDDFLWKRLGGIKTFCSTHRILDFGQDFSLVTLATVCQLKIDVTFFHNAGDGQFQRHWFQE